MQSLILRRPDDWHIHLRDMEYLKHTVSDVSKNFRRALVMPNLKPALTTLSSLLDYRERILNAIPIEDNFSPLMVFYLKDDLHPEELEAAKQYPFVVGAKLYPAGATTNSEEGVRCLKNLYPLFALMQEYSLVLEIHAETTEGDIFEREGQFITQYIADIVANFPKLRIVIEHISTKIAVDFVKNTPETVAATITPQHLLYNRNQLLSGGLRPHYYCLPILKHAVDQQAIRAVVASGHPKFFAGTDSAPHTKSNKENACACAGIYSSPFALNLYAQIFEDLHAMPHLNRFLSEFGADFYQLPYNQGELELVKRKMSVPKELPFGKETVVPIAAGETLAWSIYED